MHEDRHDIEKRMIMSHERLIHQDPEKAVMTWRYLMMKGLSEFRLLRNLDLEGRRVLNVGCFFPVDELLLSRPTAEWVAVDISADVIRESERIFRELAAGGRAENVEFVQADAASLPFEDGYFDISLSHSTIDHIPGKEKRLAAVGELRRVTRSGGHVVLTVPNILAFVSYARVVRMQRRGDYPSGYAHYFTPWEIHRMIKTVGLEPVEFCSSNYNPFSLVRRGMHRLKIDPLEYLGERIGYLCIA